MLQATGVKQIKFIIIMAEEGYAYLNCKAIGQLS